MLFIQEKTIKLGGVKLAGQVKSIEISETATIEDIEDDKGQTKANQPTGYEAATISVEIILEDSKSRTQEEQAAAMQNLFKAYKQDKPKLLKIVNEDCAMRGISKVYFKSLTTKNVIAESKRTASLELVAPVIAGIKTKLKKDVVKRVKADRRREKTLKDLGRSPVYRAADLAAAKRRARGLVK